MNALVGDFLGQGVSEGVDRFRPAALEVEKLEARQLVKQRLDVVVPIPDGPEEGQADLPPEDRRGLQEPFRGRGETLDSGQEDFLDRVGHRPERLAVGHHARQLLQEERVSLGLVQDETGERLGDALWIEDGVDYPQPVRVWQRLERHLRRIRALHPGRPVTGPVGRHEHGRSSQEALHEVQ